MEALAALQATDVAGAVRVFRDEMRRHQQAVNSLNVYPVPDGDTGTNMALTAESVVSELDSLGGGALTMEAVCRAVAHGSLMGARGNSGVILSQLLRGLSGAMAAAGTVGPVAMCRALRAASDAANDAVLRPVEGTILTVARAAAEGAETGAGGGAEAAGMTLAEVLHSARAAAAEALAKTPEQLPALARAGVVDAGGAGFVVLLDALLHVVDGTAVAAPPAASAGGGLTGAGATSTAGPGGSEHRAWGDEVAGEVTDDLRYEVMYLLEAPDDTIPAFKDVWAGIGDSIVVVGGDGLWNCHIHTDEVGPAIEAALDAGRPRDIRVTDLRDQVDEVRWVREGGAAPVVEEPHGPLPRTAVVAVANGDGVRRIFRSLGVHHFVAGGQSMNPSTAQILQVVEGVRSPEIVLLPNNDNIHPVANQVCELADRPVRVVPTGSIVEAFAALLEYDPEAGADDNALEMAGSARRVVAAEVVQAVRDTDGPDGPIHAGDWLGLTRQGIEVVGDGLVEVLTSLVGKLLIDDHELVTLIEGEGASAGSTRRVTEWLEEHHPAVAVEVHHGGQPLYPYLVGIE